MDSVLDSVLRSVSHMNASVLLLMPSHDTTDLLDEQHQRTASHHCHWQYLVQSQASFLTTAIILLETIILSMSTTLLPLGGEGGQLHYKGRVCYLAKNTLASGSTDRQIILLNLSNGKYTRVW
jgi:hypothetical protein